MYIYIYIVYHPYTTGGEETAKHESKGSKRFQKFKKVRAHLLECYFLKAVCWPVVLLTLPPCAAAGSMSQLPIMMCVEHEHAALRKYIRVLPPPSTRVSVPAGHAGGPHPSGWAALDPPVGCLLVGRRRLLVDARQ